MTDPRDKYRKHEKRSKDKKHKHPELQHNNHGNMDTRAHAGQNNQKPKHQDTLDRQRATDEGFNPPAQRESIDEAKARAHQDELRTHRHKGTRR